MTVASRLDLRLNANDKNRIAHAAEMAGVSVSTFVRSAALRAASSIIAHEETLTFPVKETPHSLAARLRGRAGKRMSTDEIMRLTRGA